MTERTRALVFGEVAAAYDEVRAGYPDALVDAVLSYLGAMPGAVVEVGAGTGKATEAFAARGAPVTCLEPDRQMAAVLRRRFADRPQVTVRVCRFEDWSPPPGGAGLLYSAQAWHWVDEQTRWRRAHAALAPGGAVAIFGHHYAFADPALEAAVHAVYRVQAPELLDEPGLEPPELQRVWFVTELRGCGLFGDVRAVRFQRTLAYPTPRYVALLTTFSNHRMLPQARRAALHEAVGRAVDARGGVVDVEVLTFLALGRRS